MEKVGASGSAICLNGAGWLGSATKAQILNLGSATCKLIDWIHGVLQPDNETGVYRVQQPTSWSNIANNWISVKHGNSRVDQVGNKETKKQRNKETKKEEEEEEEEEKEEEEEVAVAVGGGG